MKARFKPKYNIRKGDSVVVITGDDKDLSKPRTVKEVLVEKGKVIVEGVNIITKHTKPSAQNTKGGIVKKEAPIHISNVMLIDEFLKPDSSENLYVWSRCLTEMREKMEDECNARVFIGGRTKGFKGKCPGILEELLIALENKHPVYFFRL